VKASGPILWLLMASACAFTPPQFGEAGPEVADPKAEEAYRAVLDRFSDHREVYSGLDTQVFAAATYQSLAFRDARVRRKATFQVWPQDKVQHELALERVDAAQAYEVVFGVSMPERKYDDFDSRTSIWRLTLVTEEGETTPISVKRVGRGDLNIRAYYPYMGEFWTMYSARFPKALGDRPLVGPATKQFTFRMASTIGRLEMTLPIQ
jgi:hypothetical protein